MTEFCSCNFAVWEAPALLKQFIEVILFIELKQSWKFCPSLELQCPSWKPTIYHLFVDTFSRYDLFWWILPGKIAFWLQRSVTKYRYFVLAQRSTALCVVMVHSVCSIELLLASFDVALLRECEKPSWIDWTFESFRDSPLHALCFALSVSHMLVAFSSESSRNLLCVTILDII